MKIHGSFSPFLCLTVCGFHRSFRPLWGSFHGLLSSRSKLPPGCLFFPFPVFLNFFLLLGFTPFAVARSISASLPVRFPFLLFPSLSCGLCLASFPVPTFVYFDFGFILRFIRPSTLSNQLFYPCVPFLRLFPVSSPSPNRGTPAASPYPPITHIRCLNTRVNL